MYSLFRRYARSFLGGKGGVMAKRIAVFGDSISKGIVFENDKLQKLDEDMVTLIAKEYGFAITNYSQYGMSLKKLSGKGTIEGYVKGLDSSEENYAVICIGGNDANYDWVAVAKEPQKPHEAYTSVEEFEGLLIHYIRLLQDAGVRVMLTTIPPVDAKRYFENVLCKKVDGEKVLEFFKGDVTNISRHQEAYNLSVIKCGILTGCPIIDLRTGFLMDRNYLRNYCIDGVHPNGGGHRFMAKEVEASLVRQGLIKKA